ncbi:MAG TPA: alpha/beta hydrolase [Methylomirabilota bacterium]
MNDREAIELETGPEPRATVIWLHGLGADGYDFVPVVEELGLPETLHLRFVFPHAPMQAVTINQGMVMRAWYDVTGDVRDRVGDERGVRASQARIEALVDAEKARGVADGAIVLAGFSQGGAIALHTGLRHRERLAGIMALSTYLPVAHTLEAEAAAANRDVPVFMAHGTYDTVIAIARARESRDTLRAAGYQVDWREYPMAHAVSAEEIMDVATWLAAVLGER